MNRLLFSEQAKQELIGSWEWYEGRQIGLGEKFLSAVKKKLSIIEKHPKRSPVCSKEFREAILYPFSY
ncbi:MAG: hypothetical protein H7X88_12835 [Gloeobacteraceae cyanobacterium ES-bin-316]|nr:hypothetical protein [Ferruginibacter sp.]